MPRYRPFLDGPWRLAMGIKALDPAQWIEIDERFAPQLAERRQLLDERRDEVLAAPPESAAGQRELLDLLLEHLPRRFPQCYERFESGIANLVTGEQSPKPAGTHIVLEADELIASGQHIVRASHGNR